MAQRKKTRKAKEDTLVDIVEVKEQAEDFFESNQKTLMAVLGAIALIVGGYFAYKQFYQLPREREASEQIYQAELQFERDSFELALLNPGGGYSGFLDLVDEYKGTDVANLASYYAGICYLHLGKFEAAISYLSDFKPDGEVTPVMKFGAMGDAYSELGRMDEAISSYKKAIQAADNDFLTPYYMKKLGLLYENQGDYAAAVKTFKQIKTDYAKSQDGFNIDKFIERAEAAAN
ncbi:MAG: tetratricopeptide repeat protein [Saprospiraceae bacterium]|nr:tetratricopeptide repeat protein [Saprospiraceae bacterium]